jgi:multidrug transporter EmrE-like cation transporter
VSGVAAAWLAGAVLAQVVGIGGLRASAGFRRPLPTVLTLVGIGASVALMSRALVNGVSLAVGYGIWTGSGIALATLGGAAVFGDRLGRRELAGVALIVLGVVVVHAGG